MIENIGKKPHLVCFSLFFHLILQRFGVSKEPPVKISSFTDCHYVSMYFAEVWDLMTVRRDRMFFVTFSVSDPFAHAWTEAVVIIVVFVDFMRIQAEFYNDVTLQPFWMKNGPHDEQCGAQKNNTDEETIAFVALYMAISFVVCYSYIFFLAFFALFDSLSLQFFVVT